VSHLYPTHRALQRVLHVLQWVLRDFQRVLRVLQLCYESCHTSRHTSCHMSCHTCTPSVLSTRVCVWHDSLMCVTRHTLVCVWHDSFMCVIWHTLVCVWHDSFLCVTRTQEYMNDSCRAHEQVMSHIMNESCHSHKWVMSHMNESRHTHDRAMSRIINESCHTWRQTCVCVCVRVFACVCVYVWDPSVFSIPVCVWHDLFMCVTTHSYVWHDSCMCVTWIIQMRDSILSVTCLICMCDTTWLLHASDMTH